jgi:hypothetical protein
LQPALWDDNKLFGWVERLLPGGSGPAVSLAGLRRAVRARLPG